MSRLFSLGTLVTLAKQRADKENSTHVTEWKSLISALYAKLYSRVVKSGLRYFETEADVVTNGAQSYALPNDHLGTLGVDYLVNATTGERRELAELMPLERNVFSGQTSVPEARAYALVGSNLVLYPKPPSGQTYKHVYVPQPPNLSAEDDATSVDVVSPDGEEFLLWGVALRVFVKEESLETAAFAQGEFKEAQDRLDEALLQRAILNARRRVVIEDAGPCSPPVYDGWWGRR